MPLTDLAIRKAAPRDRPYKVYDELGLFLVVQPAGGKLWRIRYTWQGKEKLLSPGPYPAISLAKARLARDEARRLLRDDIDPGVRTKRRGVEGDTLQAVATRWHADRRDEWTAGFAHDVWRSLELHIFPTLGDRPIAAITPLELLSVLKPLVAKGSRRETVRRVRQRVSEICRLAVLEGLRPDDPAAVLVDALPATRATPMRTLREDQVGAFLLAVIRAGNPLLSAALRLQLLTAVRPGEVREARWEEFDLEGALWEVPAARMKRRRAHLVPLSRQVVTLLRDLRLVTGHRALLFPHRLDPTKPMSENTVSSLITRVGYGDDLTPHGLRSLFSTVCHDRQFAAPDVIEYALAHVERSRTKRAYDRGDRLILRRALMQRWADHIETLMETTTGPEASRTA